jgi:hypothetical protein
MGYPENEYEEDVKNRQVLDCCLIKVAQSLGFEVRSFKRSPIKKG